MNIQELERELIRDEGLRLKPYRDTEGFGTIGIGRCLDTNGISEDEAKYMLANDIRRVCSELRKSLPWFEELSDARQRALANMAFQLGLSGLLCFKKTLAEMQAGNYAKAAEMLLDSHWAKQTPGRAVRIANLVREG